MCANRRSGYSLARRGCENSSARNVYSSRDTSCPTASRSVASGGVDLVTSRDDTTVSETSDSEGMYRELRQGHGQPTDEHRGCRAVPALQWSSHGPRAGQAPHLAVDRPWSMQPSAAHRSHRLPRTRRGLPRRRDRAQRRARDAEVVSQSHGGWHRPHTGPWARAGRQGTAGRWRRARRALGAHRGTRTALCRVAGANGPDVPGGALDAGLHVELTGFTGPSTREPSLLDGAPSIAYTRTYVRTRSRGVLVNTVAQGTDNPAAPCRVSPLLARRPGWTVSEHPSGMVIWRSPSGRHYLRRPSRPARNGRCRDAPGPR